MNELAVSELQQITAEIKVLKQQTAQNIIEIGKRLKQVRDDARFRGQWYDWLHEVDIAPQTATRMIQAFEQFGERTTSYGLSASKVFELISLPASIDRQEFIEQPHTIPSTGEVKTVDEMTVRELREVKRQLAKAQEELAATKEQAKSIMERDRQLVAENERLKREKNPEPKVIEKVVEVVPKKVQEQLEWDQMVINNAKADIEKLRKQIEELKLQQTDDFDPEQAKAKKQKLQLEADISTLQLKVYITEFLKRVGVIAFMEGALAAADPAVKRQLNESIKSLEAYLAKVKSALNSRIIVEDAQYREV